MLLHGFGAGASREATKSVNASNVTSIITPSLLFSTNKISRLLQTRKRCAASGLSSNAAWRPLSAVVAFSCLPLPEEDFSSLPSKELGPKIDLDLPRRRLQVSFTCDACGARSQRLINPNAYARGTVFVQCAGCEVYHKLVDNLGLIEEYDFRQETNTKADEAEADLNMLE